MHKRQRHQYKEKKERILAVTDQYFDDIAAFLYAIGIKLPCNMIPNALGYTVSDTTARVTNGIKTWATQNEISFQSSYVSQSFYNNDDADNSPFRSMIDLNFGSNLADYLNFNDLSATCRPPRTLLTGIRDIWALGPYSDLAKSLPHLFTDDYTLWCSGSQIIGVEHYNYPETLYLGKGSNAGIDPTAALKVWTISNQLGNTSLFIARNPPIQDVYNTIKSINTFAARKMKKVLRFSMDNNPGGGFVWDLSCALTQQHPDLIIQKQLYTASYSDDPTKAIKLTKTNTINNQEAQIYVINVDISQMLIYLFNDLNVKQ
jgi:hypothetical protein